MIIPGKPKIHGLKEDIFIEGEGSGLSNGLTGFRFSRMFSSLRGRGMYLKGSAADEVGGEMTNGAGGDTAINAGFTYFGQFVDHDITADITADSGGTAPVDDTSLVQGRSPSLDLDSVYGSTGLPAEDLQEDGFFLIADTSPAGVPADASAELGSIAQKPLPFDLPRRREGDTPSFKAIIGDDRNDENLAVAQTHLVFLKFHNRVLKVLQDSNPGDELDDLILEARRLVTLHYQHVVLHDFLAAVLDRAVHRNVVIDQRPNYLFGECAEIPTMPLEFSVAAYRFGHSLIRETYEWNAVFRQGGFGPATFGNRAEDPFSLFRFTSKRTSDDAGLDADNPLPTNWIIDWRRFLNFADTPYSGQVGHNHTRAIDPNLSPGMAAVPMGVDEQGNIKPSINLAAANLKRGSLRGIPAAQDILKIATDVDPLTEQEIFADLPTGLVDAMRKWCFHKRTPLWFYILQEANVRSNGRRLGPLGSRIVAEAFLAIAKGSRTSVFADGNSGVWTPADSPLRLSHNGNSRDDLTTLAKIIAFVDEVDPLVNPLEDRRLA